jgi:hypothetical protein
MAAIAVSIIWHVLSACHRKIRLIESNAKCRYLKNLPVKGLCARCFIRLSPSRLLLPHTPPLHTVYVYCIHYNYNTVYLFTQGRRGGGGGGANQRKIRGAIVHKAGQKFQHGRLYLQYINSIEHQ